MSHWAGIPPTVMKNISNNPSLVLNLTVDIDDVGVDLVPDGVQDELEVARRGAGE